MQIRSLCLVALLAAAPAFAQTPRPLVLDDQDNERVLSDPQLSPEGTWIAYAVAAVDKKQDKAITHVFMTSWDGKQTLQMTSTPNASEKKPKFSPDGRYLAFLSGRGDEKEIEQLWLLDRAGGEAEKITETKGSINDYAWSPDGKRLALIVEDADPDEDEEGEAKDKKKAKKPIVIDRFHFKEDIDGYLGKKRDRLHVLDLADRKLTRITSGEFDDAMPAWSPDGKRIAFVSRRSRPDFDRDDNYDVFLVDAVENATPRALTTYPAADNKPDYKSPLAFSPDGTQLAYLQGPSLKLFEYGVRKLAVVPVGGGAPRLFAESLDRNVRAPVWSKDGKSIRLLVEDDRTVYLGEVSLRDGALKSVLQGRNVVGAYVAAAGKEAVLLSTPTAPAEIFALDNGKPRQVTKHNAWLQTVQTTPADEIAFKSADGTEIHGLLYKPPGFVAGRKYPTVLRIHGGPQAQYQLSYSFEMQLLAARGYLVVTANPRGSTGRGEAFSSAIYASWGKKDGDDVLAAVDYVVAQGMADPARLGVGGWSYGGLLTNYVIARDTRFKVATSGASASNILAGYGTDQYTRDYEMELGRPWEATQTWLNLSDPFLHADRIKTPTLFLCGEKDFNVPLLNSEQMYQALKSLGLDTQLVIYPGQFHGIKRPSYKRDVLERYLAWYDKYLGGSAKEGGAP
ncbi:S9 family peptidase [Roseiterribacter gracilis]|uniref:Acyl-peptide hydrolase n=1 Tax=Roseiterribacter gracilis TaxID=2812848 RepID=A0A8S8X8D1_9PROT|nr:acylaminoacyl-peptidase [Rhodospirillales bacterium TMPK1]